MERLKERINTLRDEVHTATARAEEAEIQLKRLKEMQIDREQETTSFNKKIQLLEEQLEKAQQRLVESKASHEETKDHRNLNDTLEKRLKMMETTLEKTENELKETTEKIRDIDLRTEQAERRVQQLGGEKSILEAKCALYFHYWQMDSNHLKSNRLLELPHTNVGARERDQELIDLQDMLDMLQGELNDAEEKLENAKSSRADEDQNKSEIESREKKIGLLQIELEQSKNKLYEAEEKAHSLEARCEQLECSIMQLEGERESVEKILEGAREKYSRVRTELDETLRIIEEL
ncbi:hypothetical protein K493DRAFT_338049 [Basidiobolus meristosporus CBS 931.73]|uniref:Tropomyosin n=1 Tax=Basidiobolus meristosporus CBS 931.73 TaxID=1314790 RepID=A0A1Y1Y7H4_9FUNG|nr:hypothetical protein K493DRAFT_338049 [Basidiobolus meristosporus CBS 931.73]|eukprot:ORX93919.1 hypothetical protein K493DRAFT_338049 [Basidiobolus meristosporus CBS 931.73]